MWSIRRQFGHASISFLNYVQVWFLLLPCYLKRGRSLLAVYKGSWAAVIMGVEGGGASQGIETTGYQQTVCLLDSHSNFLAPYFMSENRESLG